MDPFTFILESFLAYLVSLAAGLRGSSIDAKAQKRLKEELESIGQQHLILAHYRIKLAQAPS